MHDFLKRQYFNKNDLILVVLREAKFRLAKFYEMKIKQQFIEIRSLIVQAKENSFKAVNTELITLYWNISK